MDRKHPDRAARSPLERYAHTGMLVVPVVFFVGYFVLNAFDVSWPRIAMSLSTVVLVGLVSCIAMFLLERRRTRRLLRQVDYRMCLRCRHVLTGLPDQGACPECGQPYDWWHQRGVWQDEYRAP